MFNTTVLQMEESIILSVWLHNIIFIFVSVSVRAIRANINSPPLTPPPSIPTPPQSEFLLTEKRSAKRQSEKRKHRDVNEEASFSWHMIAKMK